MLLVAALQCHSDTDGPNDFSTHVYDCAFEPDTENPGSFTNLVATAGGDKICFIDVSTKKVMMSYREMRKYNNKCEFFYSIDWSVTESQSKTKSITRLCAGGLHGDVKIMYPSMNICPVVFEVSKLQISVLKHHPKRQNILFTGSDDKYVRLWYIPDLEAIEVSNKETSSKPFCTSKIKLPNSDDFLTCFEFLVNRNIILIGTEENFYACKLVDTKSELSLSTNFLINIKWKSSKIALPLKIDSIAVMKNDIIGLLTFGSEFAHLCKLYGDFNKSISLQVIRALECNHRKSRYTHIFYSSVNSTLITGSDDGSIFMHKQLDLDQKPTGVVRPVDVIIEWPNCFTMNGEHRQNLDKLPKLIKCISNGQMLVSVTDCNLVLIWQLENDSPK
ncbi:hypothetical protein GJ496_003409 [Pomphorhynchus laevis]|nr:hypothetical protein GJ496_003409 [Pomphorhynchus laevis]